MGGFLVCMLASVIIVAPNAKLSPSVLISKIIKAPQLVSYKGIKTSKIHCGTNCVTAVLQVEHSKPAFTRTLFLGPERQMGTILLTRNASIWQYTPSIDGWLRIVDGNQKLPVNDVDILWNYSIKVIGEAHIAKRKTIVLEALPKSREDLSKRIWVDKEHYIIIKQETFTSEDRIINSSQYTSIEFNPKLDLSLFDKPRNIVTRAKPNEHFKIVTPGYLPKGYVRVTNGPVSAGGHPCYHMYFWNGVSGISLFQRPLAKGEVLRKVKSTQGANIISWHQSGMGFVLVGDVSIRELEHIARSIKP